MRCHDFLLSGNPRNLAYKLYSRLITEKDAVRLYDVPHHPDLLMLRYTGPPQMSVWMRQGKYVSSSRCEGHYHVCL